MTREQERAANRAAMPISTQMFDEARAIWPDAQILWASENGREIGKRPTLGPDQYEMSAETLALLTAHNEYIAARDAKGKKWK